MMFTPGPKTLSVECRYPPDPMTIAQAEVVLHLHQFCDRHACLHRRDAFRIAGTLGSRTLGRPSDDPAHRHAAMAGRTGTGWLARE